MTIIDQSQSETFSDVPVAYRHQTDDRGHGVVFIESDAPAGVSSLTAESARVLAKKLAAAADTIDPNPIESPAGEDRRWWRSVREANGLTLREVATLMGISASTLGRVERGEVAVRRLNRDSFIEAVVANGRGGRRASSYNR